MARAPITATPVRPALSLWHLLLLAAVTLVFAVWAVWTVALPAAAGPAYVNGSFGASGQADYKTNLDRRLAPQRSIGRG